MINELLYLAKAALLWNFAFFSAGRGHRFLFSFHVSWRTGGRECFPASFSTVIASLRFLVQALYVSRTVRNLAPCRSGVVVSVSVHMAEKSCSLQRGSTPATASSAAPHCVTIKFCQKHWNCGEKTVWGILTNASVIHPENLESTEQDETACFASGNNAL